MTVQTFALCVLMMTPSAVHAQKPCISASTAKQLYDQGHWDDLTSAPPCPSAGSADSYYYRGMAFARLEHWNEAQRELKTGQKRYPQDKRFPIELAGIAYKQQHLSEARKDLHRALHWAPRDPYALNFLATLYYLDGNLEAALKYWNRIDKPKITTIKIDPQLNVDPELLDRAFANSPASTLRLEDYRTSKARLDQLGVFSAYHLDLTPHSAGNSENFDLTLSATTRNGWSGSKLAGLLSLLRGAPYETVYPEFYNLHNSAFNIRSLVRWDDQKRRIFASASAPLKKNPQYRYGVYIDARNENWDTSRNFYGPDSRLENFNLEKVEGGAEIKSIVNGRWSWASGVNLSDRRFRNLPAGAAAGSPEFTNGFALEFRARSDYALLRVPEKRFTLGSNVSGSLGKFYAQSFNHYSQLQSALRAHWFPKSRGDDYETTLDFRAGKTLGRVPFDDLFTLGIERDDNNLPLRAHIATDGGKKGNAPLGRDYLLSNWETNKNVFEGGWFNVRLAPFLDTGKIYDTSDGFGSRQWLWDTGASIKLGLLGGVEVVFIYGKDLRTGRNSFYITTARR